MKYIDADRLRAEIERRIEETKSMKPSFDQFWAGQISAFKGVRTIIDSLQQEQPEVDSEEPDSDDLEEAAEGYEKKHTFQLYDGGGLTPEYDTTLVDAFKAGAEWQEKRWENNRLMAQENATEEECQREMDFVDNHIKKHHRIPTFSDAINYGIDWHQKQMPLPEDTLIFRKGVEEGRRLMMEDAVEGEVIKTNKHTSVRYKSYYGTDRYFYGIADKQFKAGDKVRIIIVKEDGE